MVKGIVLNQKIEDNGLNIQYLTLNDTFLGKCSDNNLLKIDYEKNIFMKMKI